MDRNKLASLAIIVCMVSAVSTLPAMLIVGGLQPPTVVNYYYTTNPTNTTTTNTTVYYINMTTNYNGTYIAGTPHFVNVTAMIPYSSSSTGPYSIIYSIPLVNRTIVTNIVFFSLNRRNGSSGPSSFYIRSRLNNQSIDNQIYYIFPNGEGYTLTTQSYYSGWWNQYHAIVYPNASSYVLDICGYSIDPTWTNLNVSVAIWWETW